VRALTRAATGRLPDLVTRISGNALDAASFAAQVAPADTIVHLVGVAHPAPWKQKLFRDIDLASVRAMLAAAHTAGARHIVYLSVAQPAPTMRAYVAARADAEALIRASGIPASVVRPWYVLGPGRRWPRMLSPLYWLLEQIPGTRASALRLGLVTREQMVTTLVHAVEHPPQDVRVIEVPDIRRGGVPATTA
jgi:uncharacterized protein YbjT (DUF2867 family)